MRTFISTILIFPLLGAGPATQPATQPETQPATQDDNPRQATGTVRGSPRLTQQMIVSMRAYGQRVQAVETVYRASIVEANVRLRDDLRRMEEDEIRNGGNVRNLGEIQHLIKMMDRAIAERNFVKIKLDGKVPPATRPSAPRLPEY